VLASVAVLAIAGSATAIALADNTTTGAGAKPSAPAITEVPPRIGSEYPALSKPRDASEARQLPAVEAVMSRVAERGEQAANSGANTEFARRISQNGESAEYLIPGNEVLCMVSITMNHTTGDGCAPSSSVESTGTTSLTVVPGGYELSGILPTGTTNISITNTSKQTTLVPANPNHAFEFFSATPLQKLSYALPTGGTHEGSLELPPPRNAPPPPAG
ncbi:MAG: hypothetical protein ACRDK2_08125, partial [Solirubrobacteraceae bacterium]